VRPPFHPSVGLINRWSPPIPFFIPRLPSFSARRAPATHPALFTNRLKKDFFPSTRPLSAFIHLMHPISLLPPTPNYPNKLLITPCYLTSDLGRFPSIHLFPATIQPPTPHPIFRTPFFSLPDPAPSTLPSEVLSDIFLGFSHVAPEPTLHSATSLAKLFALTLNLPSA